MKNERLFWGLLFVLGGIFLLVNKLGFFPGVNAFNLLLSLLFVAIIIKSIVRLNFAGILFPLAFICIIYDEQLGITVLTPWTLLLAALLGTIGLSLIFHKSIKAFKMKHGHFRKNFSIGKDDYETINVEDGNRVNFETSFGSSIKYINTDNFEYANLECSFGAMKVFFDNATMKNSSAVLNIDVSFGGMEIYVPKGWRVEDKASVSFGSIDYKNNSDGVITNTLVLTGDVSFSGVEIIYV